MKPMTNRTKFIVLVLITLLISVGSYTLKRSINRYNHDNQNYLATNIRKKNKEAFTYTYIHYDTPLTKQAFLKKGHAFYQTKKKPLLIELTDLSIFELGTQHPATVYYTLDEIYGERLYVGMNYTTSRSEPEKMAAFSFLSSKEVHYLAKPQMLYSLSLDTNAPPTQWFPEFVQYVTDMRQTFKDQSQSSLVYLTTNNQKYLYISARVPTLFTIQQLDQMGENHDI